MNTQGKINRKYLRIGLPLIIAFIMACNFVTGGAPTSATSEALQATMQAPVSTSTAYDGTGMVGGAPTTTAESTDQLTDRSSTEPTSAQTDDTFVPNMNQPLTGETYEPRNIRVDDSAPTCPNNQVKKGDEVGFWSTQNHAYITGYANNWQPEAQEQDGFPYDSGARFKVDHEDNLYYYVENVEYAGFLTLKKSEVSCSTKQPAYYPVNLYAPWGPHFKYDAKVGTWNTWYGYGLGLQYSLVEYYPAWESLIKADVEPSDNHWFEGRDDFRPYKLLKVVGEGVWLQDMEGRVFWSKYMVTNYWPDPWQPPTNN